MTRQLPAITRLALLICAALLLGTAGAQDPLGVPTSPDRANSSADAEAPAVEQAPPTVEPMIPPGGSLGRFDPGSGRMPDIPLDNLDAVTRTTFDAAKLDGALNEMLGYYVRGNVEAVERSTRNYFLPQDDKGRYLVIVLAASDVPGKQAARTVRKAGGDVQYREGKSIYARLTPLQIAILTHDAHVALIQPQAVSRVQAEPTSATLRDPAGSVFTEGFDVANAFEWHDSGNLGGTAGDRVTVGIIDFGFGSSTSAGADLSCLNSYPSVSLAFGTIEAGDTRRGLDMAEIVCDIAPEARVRLYKATSSNTLYDAINSADNTNNVIIIGTDFGANFSPGDGTFGRASAKNVYQAIATAKANGVVVLAAAGNAAEAYTAISYTGNSPTIQLQNLQAGDTVSISWNDWDDAPNGGGAREDVSANLSSGSFTTLNKPARGGGNPSHQFTVPGGCGGGCNATLGLTGLTGNANPVIVQISIGGGFGRTIGTVTGATVLTDFGTISRPADSPDAIAVGAVCVDYTANFPRENYSGTGPRYSPGGSAPSLDPAIAVKPDVVGPANVSVFNNQITGIDGCDAGLRGTQASVAHVGAMVALLINSTASGSFSGLSAGSNVLHYLRTHSIDLPMTPDAGGYDFEYGAGLPVLGQPDFDYDGSITIGGPVFPAPNRLPSGECLDGLIYVGTHNVGDFPPDGSATFPFQSIMQAAYTAAVSPGQDCVIVLPGEYSTPLNLSGLNNDVGIYGYKGVTLLGGVQPTTLVTQNRYYGTTQVINATRNAGIYVNGGGALGGTTIGGFEFHVGGVFDDSSFARAQILAVESAQNFTFTRAVVENIISNQTLIEIFGGSENVTISESTFSNNTGQSGASLIAVYDSGTPADRVTIRGNLFEGNRYNEGSWLIRADPSFLSTDWVSLIHGLDSYVDIVSNTMRSNEAESLLQGATSDGTNDHQFRVLGNAIIDTTISSADGFTPGPLIHGFFQRYIAIVNNTIAETKFVGSGPPYNTLFARGDAIENNAVVGGDLGGGLFAPCGSCASLTEQWARWEIRGNLIMNNLSASLVGDLDAQFSSGGGCVAFEGIWNGSTVTHQHEAAQHNWIVASGNNGNCNDSLVNVAHNNVLNIDPTTLAQPLLQGGPDNTLAEYYAPVSNGQPEPNLIDDGPDAFLATPANGFTSFLSGTDVRGALRDNANIDIGAYEYTPFNLVDPIGRTANEDSGVIEFDINDPLFIEGGFPPYTAQVLTYPPFFGTHCDSRFASQLARGMAVEFVNANTLTIAYCPPRHFHTQSAAIPSGYVEVQVLLTDSIGNATPTHIQYTINQVNDSALTATLGDDNPAGDIMNAAVAINTAPAGNVFRLRPFVSFSNNFVFSETNNNVVTAAKTQVDYDYTYGTPTLVVGDPVNVNPENISNNLSIDTATGVVSVNTVGVLVESTAKLQYTVTDRNANMVTNFMIVRAVSPPEPFNQLTPPGGFVVNNIDQLTGFTWEISGNSQTYDLSIDRIVQPGNFHVPVLTLTGLMPGVGNLTCATSCLYTLSPAEKQLLVIGDYEWLVKADNVGLKADAANGPLAFSVNTGKELILNGDFEVQGTNTKKAANWSLANGSGEKRKCPGGVGDSCFFEFSAAASGTAKLTQKPAAIGRKGDVLAFTAASKSKSLSANKGVLQVVIKYTTADKVKMKLTAPNGTTADYQTLTTAPVVLDFPVESYKVTLQIKPGKGKMSLDNVSLVLDEEISFSLLTPGDNFSVTADNGYVSQLTWESSASAASYDVTLIRTIGPVNVIDGTFTAAADLDALTCAMGQCVFNITPLTDGDYVWTVDASNGATANNAPFNFTVDTTSLTELVTNGDFEESTGSNLPKNWKAKGTKGGRTICESGTSHPEYQGACAWRFSGESGLNASLSQNLPKDDLAVNDRLILRGAAFLAKAFAGAEIKLQITYNDNSKETRKITLNGGSALWTAYEADPITLSQGVKKATVTLSYKGSKGKVLMDNVSVIVEPGEPAR